MEIYIKKAVELASEPRGLAQKDRAIITRLTEFTARLLCAHWSDVDHIADATDKTPKITMGFGVGRDGHNVLVRAKISFARQFSDQVEGCVDDPRQQKLFEDVRITSAKVITENIDFEEPTPKKPSKNKPLTAPIAEKLNGAIKKKGKK
jgi:hypothetical protein